MSKLGVTPWDIVRAPAHEAGGFIDANPLVASDDPVRLVIDENGDEKDAQRILNSVSQKQLIQAYNPALFTGGMRKLMQVSHLRGESWFSHAKHHLFLHGWSDTYGIFIGSAQDGECPRYVIRICSSGIYRIPLNFSKPLPANWQTLETSESTKPAIEGAQTIGRMWSAGDFDPTLAVKIGDAPAMYSGYSGFYGACGWAFDANGHHAVNTAWRVDPADGSSQRKMASRWLVTITDEAGVPVSASCTKAEEDYLMNPKRDDLSATENNAIIQVATELPGVCQTFPCWPGFSNFAGVTSSAAPVFAYYDQTDSLQVVHYNYAANASDGLVTSGSDAISTYTALPNVVGNIPSGLGTAYGANRATLPGAWYTSDRDYVPTPLFSSVALGGGSQGFSGARTDGAYLNDGPSGYLQNENWSISYAAYNVRWFDQFGDPHDLTRRIDEPDRANWRVRTSAQGYTKHTTSSHETQNNYDCLILHGYDRTSYVHFRYEGNSKTSKVRQRIGIGVARGTTVAPELSQDGGSTYNSLSLGSLGYAAYEGSAVGVVWHEHDGSIYSDASGDIVSQAGVSSGGLGPNPAETYYDPNEYTDSVQMFLVIGNQPLELEGEQFLTDGNMVTDIYLGGATFNYTACGSWFRPERVAYDTYLNATSIAAGFGYPNCANRLHAFLGFF